MQWVWHNLFFYIFYNKIIKKNSCVEAEPFIKDVLIPLAEKQKIFYFECNVGPRDTYIIFFNYKISINKLKSFRWKNKEHPLRKNKNTKLFSVPAILFFTKVNILFLIFLLYKRIDFNLFLIILQIL